MPGSARLLLFSCCLLSALPGIASDSGHESLPDIDAIPLPEPLVYYLPGGEYVPAAPPVTELIPVAEDAVQQREIQERIRGLEPVEKEVIEVEQPDPEEDAWERDEEGEILIEGEEPPEDEDRERYRVPGPCGEWEGGELRWYDRTHGLVSETLCWPSRWFDNFFGDPDVTDAYGTGTYLRLTGAQAWQDDGENPSRFSYSASARLPGVQERRSLILADDDDDREEALLRRAREIEDEDEEDTATRAGLRLVLRAHEAMDLDTDLGVSGGLPYGRLRYRERWAITEEWSMRFTEELSRRSRRGWDSLTRIEFDRSLGGRSSLKFDTRAEWVEEDFDRDGWYGRQSASISTRLSPRSAISYSASIDGYTRPHAQVENYRVGTRFRQNIWRPWLFYEVEPFVRWSRDQQYDAVHGAWFRLEMRLGLYDY